MFAFTASYCYNKNMKQVKNKAKWPLVGNSHIVDFLSKSIKKDSLSGAYIFNGPDNLGKTTLASFFAQILLCQDRNDNFPCGSCSSCYKFINKSEEKEGSIEDNLSGVHSDLYIVKKDKDKKNVSIEQIREFIRKLGMSSFLNSYKIGIIKNANSLSIGAANALLKTLEEPKEKVIIILITSDIDAIPLTIASRSQILNFNPVKFDIIYDYLIKDHKASRSAAKNFSQMCLGRPALAIKFLEDKEFYNFYSERVNIFLNFLNQDINDRIKSIENLIGNKSVGQESSRLAGRTIEIWQGVIRDMLLLEFNQIDLIQHEITHKDFQVSEKKISLNNLLNLTDALRRANEYLKANINPKIVLEQIAINV